MSIDWNAIVKTYDVRGLVGKQLTTEIIAALAAGFVAAVLAVVFLIFVFISLVNLLLPTKVIL